jgi:phosphoribosylanthranilate isomerase
MSTAVKICGITRVEDALLAASAGAHAIGTVLYSRSPRAVEAALARRIVRAVPPFVTTVTLLVDPTAAEVERVLEEVQPSMLQFHGNEDAQFCSQFGVPYIKAVRIRPGVDLLQYARLYADAKGLLLDAFVEGSPGGTGASFDWGLIPKNIPLPIILAGGLTPENVTEAIRKVRPWAVDVASGVESAKGIKDAAKVAAFVRGARNADV